MTRKKTTYEELEKKVKELENAEAERNRAEKSLQKNEERLELAVEGADLGTWDWNIETGINITNKRWAEMLGYSVDEINKNYSGWEALIHPKDLDNTLAALKSHLDHGTKYEVEFRMATKHGAWIWIQAAGQVVDRDRDGNPLRMLGIHYDITDRKLAEEALRESEGRHRLLTENARDMIYRMGLPGGRYEYVSPAAKDLFGYTPDEFYSTPQLIRKAIHPDWQDYFAEQWTKLLAGDMPPFYEYQIIDKAGNERWLYQRNVLVCDDDGKPIAIEGIVTDITERKWAEEALRESEERYRSLYLNTPTMLHSIDQQGKLVSVSHQWLTTLGYEREEVIGRKSTDFLTDESRKYANEVVLPEFYKNGQIFEVCYQFVKKNGDVIDVSLSAIAEKDENGKIIRSMAILNDITERKQAEEALRESEERYRTLFETLAQGVVYQDAEGKIISANPASERILGLTLSQMQGRTSIDTRWKAVREDGSEFTGDDHPSMLALKTGREIRNTIMGIFHPQDNEYHWINIYAVPQFRPGEKKPYQVYTTFEDITERKQAEEALLNERDRAQRYLDVAGVIIIALNAQGQVNLINRKGCEILGYSEEELINREWFDNFLPERNRKMVKETFLKLMAGETEGVENYENPVLTSSSEEKIIAWHNALLYEEDGQVVGILSSGEDITERKRAEEALRESEEMLRGILNQSSIVIYAKDVEGRFLLINREFEKLFHISNEKIVGKTDFDIFPKENAQVFRENDLEALRSDAPIEREEVIPQEDGLHTYISVKFQLKNTDGKPFAICGISTDITEHNQLEVERTKAAKLESIGLLAGGIAHDFNNILSAILGNVSLANMIAREEQSEASESLTAAEAACGRARDLTQQLLTFSKGGAPVKKAISLAGLIKETSGFALRGSNVICRHYISKDLWPCEVDEGQISQVINNLLINSDQAMPEGGTIVLRAENVTVGKKNQLPLKDGGYIKLSVKDQGLGIPKEHLSKIFDPYFSTKQKGSGLGLATTYSIIKRHAGHVTVESGPNVGTTFHIYLPATRKIVAAKEPKQKKIPAIRGKILVMDDERALRNVISKMLERIGHEVECASDGERAVKIYKQAKKSGQPFDALILDLTIPGGMGGRETIAKLLEIDPEVRAIVSSGYSNDPVISNYQDYGFSGEVSKPYQIEQLRAVLQTVMKGKKG